MVITCSPTVAWGREWENQKSNNEKACGSRYKNSLKMRGKGRGTQTDAKEVTFPTSRPVPSQPPKRGYHGRAKPPVLWLSLALCDTQHPFGQPLVLSWLCPLPASCQPHGGQRKPWHPASPVQQHLEHWSAISTISVVSCQGAGCDGAINSITASPSKQLHFKEFWGFFSPLSPVQLFAVFFPILLHRYNACSLITSSLWFFPLLPFPKEVCNFISVFVHTGRQGRQVRSHVNMFWTV